MRLGSQRSSRSVDYLLATLSPLEVSRSTRDYLRSLDDDALQRLIERSLTRMDDDERAYFAISPDFATFLDQNRRALRTLDRDALRAILMPVILSRTAQVDGTEDDGMHVDELSASLRAALPPLSAAAALERLFHPFVSFAKVTADRVYGVDAAIERGARRTFPVLVRAIAGLLTACGVVAAGAAIALLLVSVVVPAGRHTVAWISSHPLPHIALAPPSRPALARTTRPATAHHAVQHLAFVQRTPHPAATVRPTPRPTPSPAPTQTATPTAAPSPTTTPTATPAARIAAVPKHHRHTAVRPKTPAPTIATAVAAATPSSDAPLVQRARLIVMSYLDSLMRGDASSALGNLGLSASAGTSNLTEAPILAGATEFRIVRAMLTSAGNAKVQVVIESPQGRFFGDYIVSANGPAAWITQHEVIPVESTASRHQ